MAFIEFHLLQNFAPSNLNRDDNNTPKSCVFGGVRRARISSQCQKRQIRLHPAFKEAVAEQQGDIAIRTKKLAFYLRDHLIELGKTEEHAATVATRLLSLVSLKVVPGVKLKKDDSEAAKNAFKTQYLLYLGNTEIDSLKALAAEHFELLLQEKSDTKDVLKQLKQLFKRETIAADIAMFGRMVADNTEMNIDAACQVAHAISTNAVQNDSDFFTAVEDGNDESEQGSGMMGTMFFNSACYYRYAQIDLQKLKKNLGVNPDLTASACLGFLRALVDAKPSGKQNSFAAQNPVSYVRVVLRESGSAMSLSNAFSKPIDAEAQNTDLETASAEALQSLSLIHI